MDGWVDGWMVDFRYPISESWEYMCEEVGRLHVMTGVQEIVGQPTDGFCVTGISDSIIVQWIKVPNTGTRYCIV